MENDWRCRSFARPDYFLAFAFFGLCAAFGAFVVRADFKAAGLAG